MEPAGEDGELQVQARALGVPSRHEIFRFVTAADGPVDVAAITAAIGLHHNAVRQHLAKLRDAGLVEEFHDRPHGRGRPRLLYRVAADLDGRWQAPDAYVHLAGLLADAMHHGRTPRQAGHQAGQRAVAERGQHHADGVEAIRAEAARLGFDPEVTARRASAEIVLRHCPFSAVAASDPGVVCQLHLGLAEGIADAMGDVTVTGLRLADPHHAGCRLQLRRTPPPR